MAGTPTTIGNGAAPAAGEDPARVIPRRIHAALPEVKLIALLRDPVKRCVSEHGMAVLRGTEEKSIDEAVRDLLRPESLAASRAGFSPTNCYVAGGEYGRVLAPYFELFGAAQILVLHTSELADDPRAVVRQVCAFVGVDEGFVPPNLGERYLEGAQRPRHRALDLPGLARRMRESEQLRRLWRRIPTRLRQRAWTVSYRVEKWNRAESAPTEKEGMSAELEATLRSHFHPDRELLTELTGAEPPWQ
jgi:hypothetical protein